MKFYTFTKSFNKTWNTFEIDVFYFRRLEGEIILGKELLTLTCIS